MVAFPVSVCASLVLALKIFNAAAAVADSHDTPVTRVVGLLKGMAKTVKAEQDEDEELNHKLGCWCNNNDWEKSNAIEKAEAKIADLQSTIESLTGSTAELRASIKELETEFAADKKALAEATAIREKQLDEFHNMEKDAIQAVENLKAAIEVLSKHHDAPPASTVAGGAIFKSDKDSWDKAEKDAWMALLQVQSSKDFPSENVRSFNNFMRDSGLDETLPITEVSRGAKSKFLQQQTSASLTAESEWSVDDTAVVKRALKSAAVFVQSRNGDGYYPAYNSQSGEIMGILKQMKEEMEGDLSESQKREADRAAGFADLRAAKTQEIKSGEKMAEEKEDLLANQDNALAEAKEDLGQEQATLAADQKFMKNLKETCAEADKNFQARKNARLEELKAISATIEILTGDDARDAMSGTFNFVQISSTVAHSSQRRQAATTLRRAAVKLQEPLLSVLATSVELDAFTKVKKAIDHMISVLKQQQKDEVKKNDWCKSELQSNDMATERKESQQADLEALITKLESDIKALETGIAEAKADIVENQLNLQSASMERKTENLDFQKVIADQTTTIEVLHQALDKLAKFYDLVQTSGNSWIQRQTPDVPQMEYKKSKGATGVMEMIEKLIYDSQELMKESKKSESDAQVAYEKLVADTNDSVRALQKEIVSKTQAKADAEKDRREAHSDLSDTMKDLDGLAKYNAELHTECDYVMKNFDVRQNGRAQEIEALQQAKQILNGASLS